MNKHKYEVVVVTRVEESSNEMADEKAFAKKAQTFFGSQSKISRFQFQTYISKSKKSSERHGLQ